MGGAIVIILFLVCFILLIITVAGVWKTFQKAGKPGWAAIVPIYGQYIMIQIAGRQWWWLLLMLIPYVNIVVDLIISIDIARAFGKSAGFGVGLFFLPFVFYPLLAGSDAVFTGK
jgi:hypothetical protein